MSPRDWYDRHRSNAVADTLGLDRQQLWDALNKDDVSDLDHLIGDAINRFAEEIRQMRQMTKDRRE